MLKQAKAGSRFSSFNSAIRPARCAREQLAWNGGSEMGDLCGLWEIMSQALTPIRAIKISMGRLAWYPFVRLRWNSTLPSALETSGSTGVSLEEERGHSWQNWIFRNRSEERRV